jgi:hypothetical protein
MKTKHYTEYYYHILINDFIDQFFKNQLKILIK